MSDRQLLPEGMADMPPGPQLATALAGVDRTRLASDDLYTLVQLQARQIAHDQAQLLAGMLETARAGYTDDMTSLARHELDEFSADQLAFTLRWSRMTVAVHLDLAQELIERLPAVYAALDAGLIDLPRAKAFAEALTLLDDETARRIADRLLGKAADLTPGQLRERLRYWALKADPGLARKRYRKSVTDRRVYYSLNDDGTASLGGVDLPPDRAAAAANRLDRLARAAKADGDVRTLTQLRADAMLAIITGAPFTLRPPTDPYTASADAEERANNPGGQGEDAEPMPQPGRTPRDTEPDRATTAASRGRRDNHDDEAPPQPGGSAGGLLERLRRSVPSLRPGRSNSTGATDTEPSDTTRDAAGADAADADAADKYAAGGDAAGGDAAGGDAADDEAAGGAAAGAARAGEGAALSDAGFPEFAASKAGDVAEPPGGWDGEPPDEPDPGEDYVYRDDGEGYDPIGAAGLHADPLPARLGDGRIDLDKVATPDQPHLCACGGVQPAPRRGEVDMRVELTTLMCLNDNPGLIPGWGPVVADIARQVALDQETNPMWRWSVVDDQGNLLHHGHTRRRPTAEEKAFVKARDRTCQAPGCRRPAMWCDDDHRREYAKGGPSHRANLCVLCRHHHRLRHERGFVVHQISAGAYLWEAPNKRLYMVLPDGNLLQAADGIDEGPPPGHVRAALALPDDDQGDDG